MKSIQEKLSQAERIISEFESLRKNQKEYFRTRDRTILNTCKIQEKKIDQMIKIFKDKDVQKGLWPDQNKFMDWE